MKSKVIYYLLIIVAFLALSFKDKETNSLELQKLVIKEPNGKKAIILEMEKDTPRIAINDETGTQMSIMGNILTFYDKNHEPTIELSCEDDPQVLVLKKGKSKISFNSSGIFLKNEKEKIVGSLTTLADGGGGFGLADSEGMASSILRGGSNPSLALFGNKVDPITSFGVLQNVPHLLLSGDTGNESVLLHGGTRSGMMVLDEEGKLKVFICKDGIYQGKESLKEESNKKEKYFSYTEDKKYLFPQETMR